MQSFSKGSKSAALLALRTALTGGKVLFFDGPLPASADAATTGSNHLLLTINPSGGIAFEASLDAFGAVVKSAAQPWDGVVSTTGVPTFYRVIASGDDGVSLTTTAARIQGQCGTAGVEMVMTSATFVSGATEAVNYYSIGAADA